MEALRTRTSAPQSLPSSRAWRPAWSRGKTFSTVLNVIETNGRKVTPAEIKSLQAKDLKLTPADVAALGTILTPTEKQSGALALTAGQAQLAKIDRVTLALVMTAGIKVPQQLSTHANGSARQDIPQAVLLHGDQRHPVVPTSGETSTSMTGNNPAALNLGNGQTLDITIDGKPIAVNQLPSAPSTPGSNLPSQRHSTASLVGTYLGAAASSKASGIATSGAYDVATQLLTDPNLRLLVTPNSLSQSGSNCYLTELGSAVFTPLKPGRHHQKVTKRDAGLLGRAKVGILRKVIEDRVADAGTELAIERNPSGARRRKSRSQQERNAPDLPAREYRDQTRAGAAKSGETEATNMPATRSRTASRTTLSYTNENQ
jgi:hypothetical protein